MIISQRTFHLLTHSGIEPERLAEILHALAEDSNTFTAPRDELERKRTQDRERQQRYRATRNVTSRESRDERDPPRPQGHQPALTSNTELTQPLTPTPPIVPPPPKLALVGGGDGWPTGNQVRALVETVESPWLDPAKSPGLITTSARLAAWRRDGASWEHDVVPVVTGLCAGQRGPISTWKFFDRAIAQSIADNRQALTIPEARATGPPNFADRAAAEKAEAKRQLLAEESNARHG